jgi:glycosyltransferase involved in cell wall biosynthesis
MATQMHSGGSSTSEVKQRTPLIGARLVGGSLAEVRLHINAVGAVMGGAARHLRPFVTEVTQIRPGWEVVVYVSPDAPALSDADVRIHTIARKGRKRIVWDSITVGRVADREGADVLLNLTNYGPIRSPVPSILYQRNPVYFDPAWVRSLRLQQRTEAFLRRQLAYIQMQGSAATVVPSCAMAGYLRSWRGFPPTTRIEIIPHAVDVERFRFEPAKISGQVRMVSLSHAAPHKGQELLVDLIRELRQRGIDAILEATICDEDDPTYVASLRERVRNADLDDYVRFVGRVDAAEFLAGADVMVFPSRTESFGFPLVEAMACGVPVVASAIPSTTEILGHMGWYFPVGNSRVAADQVIAVLQSRPGELDRRLRAARDSASSYSWERNAANVVRLLEGVVGQ